MSLIQTSHDVQVYECQWTGESAGLSLFGSRMTGPTCGGRVHCTPRNLEHLSMNDKCKHTYSACYHYMHTHNRHYTLPLSSLTMVGIPTNSSSGGNPLSVRVRVVLCIQNNTASPIAMYKNQIAPNSLYPSASISNKYWLIPKFTSNPI